MAHTAKLDSKPNNSLWAESSTRSVSSLAVRSDCDVAIIGGGFSGLWTAYHLLQRNKNLSISIFEAQRCGFGASGRNGGWASSDYPVYWSTLKKRYGADRATQLFDALVTSIDEIGEVARTQAPQAHFVKSGTVMFARNIAQEKRLKANVDSSHHWLNASELTKKIRIEGALGGLFNPHCATINPMGLVEGLVRTLHSFGVSIFEGVYASRVDGGILANSVFVSAPIVIQATEVFGEPGREFIPLYSQMVATEPLSEADWSEIGAETRLTFAEGSHLINYAQRTADNRLAIGGRGATYPLGSALQSAKEMTEHVHQRLRSLARSWFPVLEKREFTHAWGGAVAITRDWEPYVHFDSSTGFGRLGGYAGDGVTMSYLAAKILSNLVTETTNPITELHFVNRKIRKWEPEPLRYIAVNSLVKLSGIADSEEAKTGRPSFISKIIEPLILR